MGRGPLIPIRTVARGGSILSPGMAGRILDELSQLG
jgi:hypothetical protein